MSSLLFLKMIPPVVVTLITIQLRDKKRSSVYGNSEDPDQTRAARTLAFANISGVARKELFLRMPRKNL